MYTFKRNDGSDVVDMFERSGSHYNISLSLNEKFFKNGGTIFDGELVQKRDGKWEYQIFDCLCTIGYMFDKHPYSTRLSVAESMLTKYYEPRDSDPFLITVKKPLTSFEHIKGFLEGSIDFGYATDGIILISETNPYHCNKDTFLYKYKKTEGHTIDFLLKLKKATLKPNLGNVDILDMIENTNISTQVAFLLFPEEGDMSNNYQEKQTLTGEEFSKFFPILGIDSVEEIDGLIVECYFNGSIWAPKYIRLDKIIPNNVSTFLLTQKSIDDNITINEVLSFFS